MTYIIGMVSQKGGVGKSTLARMMAREFVTGGLSTKIADLDTQQQTCTHWAGRRAALRVQRHWRCVASGRVLLRQAAMGGRGWAGRCALYHLAWHQCIWGCLKSGASLPRQAR